MLLVSVCHGPCRGLFHDRGHVHDLCRYPVPAHANALSTSILRVGLWPSNQAHIHIPVVVAAPSAHLRIHRYSPAAPSPPLSKRSLGQELPRVYIAARPALSLHIPAHECCKHSPPGPILIVSFSYHRSYFLFIDQITMPSFTLC